MKFFTEFKKLHIRNSLMFKSEFEIPLSNQGIISVIGINKDANGSNGAGKSTLFDILRAVHLGSSADGRRDIDFLGNKGESSIGYVARYGNDEYEIIKNRGDKTFGNNTIILKNGESVGFKKDNNATKKSIYQEFVKIPEAVFDNCVILRTDKAHTLIRGTPSERIEFISNLCGLNYYDEINKVLKERLKDVTDKIDSLREDEALLADISNTLSNLSSKEEIEENVAKKSKKVNELKGNIKDLESTVKKHEKTNEYCKLILKYYDKIGESSTTSKDDREIYLDKKEELSSIKKKLSEINDELSKYKTYKELKSNPIGTKGDVELLEKSINDISKKLDYLEDDLDENKKYKELKKQINEIESLGLDEEFISNKINNLSQKKLRLEILTHVVGHKFCECPICGSKVNSEKMSLDKDSLKEDYSNVVKKIERLKNNESKLRQLRKLKSELKELTYHEGLEDKINKLNKEKSSYEKELSEAIKYKEYQAKLSKLKNSISNDEETLNSKKSKLSEKQDELEKYIENISNVIEQKKELENLEQESGINRDEAEDKFDSSATSISKCVKGLEELKEKLSYKTKKLGQLEESLANVTNLLRKKEKLETNLESLPKLRKKKDFINNLVIAYSSNGLKAVKVNAILEALKIKLKEYTSVLFSEKDIDFDIKADNSRFSIMCIRKDEHGNEVCRYDVRSLSGGEKARFVLAIVFALDDITSPSMKVNFKVLDEIDAKLDSVGKQVLIERFIPMLRAKASTLFIVSHDSDVRDANIYDAKLIVKKKNRISTVKLEKL